MRDAEAADVDGNDAGKADDNADEAIADKEIDAVEETVTDAEVADTLADIASGRAVSTEPSDVDGRTAIGEILMAIGRGSESAWNRSHHVSEGDADRSEFGSAATEAVVSTSIGDAPSGGDERERKRERDSSSTMLT